MRLCQQCTRRFDVIGDLRITKTLVAQILQVSFVEPFAIIMIGDGGTFGHGFGGKLTRNVAVVVADAFA